MRLRWAGCLVLMCALAASPAARAQIDSREGIALQNQILELRHQLATLREQVLRGTPAAGGSVLGGYEQQPTSLSPSTASGGGGLQAQLLDRVQRLEEAVRDLRGKIDDANNTRQQQYDDLNKKIDDLAFRLGVAPAGTLPGAAPAGTPGVAPPSAGGTLPAVPPANAPTPLAPPPPAPPPPPASPTNAKRTPELVLQEGYAALSRHDYAAAEADAKQVLANGKGPRATDAQFLLAEALAGRHDYSAAAVAYDDAYNRSRTGVHAQASLLGLARALTAINEKRAACATLDKLRAEFPKPRPELRENIQHARHAAECH